MKSPEFWHFFESVRPQLELRSDGFAAIFEYLDRFNRPVGIVETGCSRDAANWRGDGNSTLLWDRYAQAHPGTMVYSVDIDPKATNLCRSLVGNRVHVHTGDSVQFLQQLSDRRPGDLPFVDLLYLDSYDLNFDDTMPSALHHMKELIAGAPMIREDTLVAVDDCYLSIAAIRSPSGSVTSIRPPKIDGKGRYIADYAEHVGAEKLIDGYQCGWVKMRTST